MGFVAERVKKMACPKCGHEFDPTGAKALSKMPCPECKESIRVQARFGKFLLRDRLGVGPSGVVFEAFDEQLHRQVALKILKSDGKEDEKMAKQFIREARTIASLSHQNIVRIYDLGQYKDQHYIEMEMVKGGKVKDYLKAKTDELEMIDLAISVADGLNVAKQAQLVHTNVGPGTILLDEKKQPKLIDFGFGQYLLDDSTDKVDPGLYYIAPEVARGSKHDFKSDMYNLGATMFHLLAGLPPFQGQTRKEVIEARFSGGIPKLSDYRKDLNPATVQVVRKMMSLDPDRRHGSYEDLIEELFNLRESIASGVQVHTTETAALASAATPEIIAQTVGRSSSRPSTRAAGRSHSHAARPPTKSFNPLMIVLPAAAAIVLVLVIGVVIMSSGDKPTKKDDSNLANNNSTFEDSDAGNNNTDNNNNSPNTYTPPPFAKAPDINSSNNSQLTANTKSDTNSTPTVQRDSMLHWPLDGNARDVGGGLFHGLKRGNVSFIKPGRVGSGAMKLTGGGWLSIQHNVEFMSDLREITVMAWVKLPNKGKQKQWAGIITKGDTSWRLGVTDRTNGKFHFAVNMGREDRLDTKKKYNDGKWHHLAGVFDGKTLRIFVDGELENSKPPRNKIIKANTADIQIGANSERTGRGLDGEIDEPRIYFNKALSADEIRKLAQEAPVKGGSPTLVKNDKTEPETGTTPTGLKLTSGTDVPKGNLLGYWPFDNDASDATGVHRSRLIGGARIVDDNQRGRVAEFDGKSGYVDLGSGYEDFTKGLTFSLWVKPTVAHSWGRFLDLGNGQDQQNIVFARMGTNEDLVFTHQTAGRKPNHISAPDLIKLNVWQHLAVTVNANGQVRFYKDGQFIAEKKDPKKPEKTIRMSNYAAKSNWANDRFFQGRMDELVIYNRTLTDQEIATLGKGDSTPVVVRKTDPKNTTTERRGPVEPGLKAHWTFDELKGNSVTNEAGSKFAGMFAGGKSEPGAIGQCLTLEGTAGVRIADSAEMSFADKDYTISGWVKTAGDGTIISKSALNGMWAPQAKSLAIKAGKLIFAINQGGVIKSATKVSDNQWHHVAVTYEKASVTYQLFFDGQSAAKGQLRTGPDPAGFITRIGFTAKNFGPPLKGSVDDLRFYDRKLKNEDIERLANKQPLVIPPPKIGNLLAHWTFDKDTATKATNVAGDQFQGTVDKGSFAAGRLARGLYFDGKGEVKIADSDRMSFANRNYSIAAWIQTNRDGTIFSKAPAAGKWAPQGKTFMVVNGKLAFDVGWKGQVKSGQSVSDGKWRHVAVTFDAKTNQYDLFIDGKADGSGKLETKNDPAGFIARIGSTSPDFGGRFHGMLDDIRFYEKNLTTEEIINLAAMGKSEVTPPIATGAGAKTQIKPVDLGTGKILVERWNGVPGELSELVKKIAVKPTPDKTEEYTKLQLPNGNHGDNYGLRARGYIYPPTTGKYEFTADADDRIQVWVSDDHKPENKKKVAEKGKASIPVDLEGGKIYYIEVLHKEMQGGDGFIVNWKLPDGKTESPIPGSRLSVKLPPSHMFKFIDIKPADAKAQTATLSVQQDGSVLAGGANKVNDVYTIRFDTNVSNMTAIQLLAIPDDSLPSKGPGRGAGGMFTLDELMLTAAPRSSPSKAVAVDIASSKADFAIPGYSVKNATDGKPKTYWGVRGRSGQQRVATFIFKSPVGGPKGTVLTLTLRNNFNLGRFRLLATSYDKPLEIEDSGTREQPVKVVGANPNPGGATAPKGPYKLYVNGSDKSFTDPRGIKWVKVKAYKAGSWGYIGRVSIAREDEKNDAFLRTCAHGMDGFHFDVPNGKYKVALYFTEYWTGARGRVFGVSIEGETVAEGLDLAEKPGTGKPLIIRKTVEVKDGKLEIDFSTIASGAIVNGLSIEAIR